LSQTDPRVLREIAKCASDFHYLCRNYLKIVDKKGNVVPFIFNDAQDRFLAELAENPWVFILKARQLGMTTVVAAYLFWNALLKPNFKVGVLAHQIDSAESIFEIYKRFYLYLPQFLKRPTERSNVREMKFTHGGSIRVATANSEGIRGSTLQALHCSEFAFWSDPDKTIASTSPTLGPNAMIILETTANGMNDAHRMWTSKENGYRKVFFPWMENEKYTKVKFRGSLHPKVKAYAKDFGLDKGQSNWLHETYQLTCMGNWNTLLQEYPATADQAFITSGEKFFETLFPHAQAKSGYVHFRDPQPYRVYALGVDTASGSPSGDYSAFAVVDVTDKKKPVVCSTYYQRIAPHEFSERVHQEARKYDALCIVESNSYGLAVLEHLIGRGYAYVFKRTQYDKMGERFVEKVGFNTNVSTRPVMLSRLNEYISKGWLDPTDDRMKHEMNTFIYNDRGKPIAQRRRHDDMIFAYALSLMGMDQLEAIKEEVQGRPPQNLHEMLQFELNTGKVFSKEHAKATSDRWGVPYAAGSMMDSSDLK
jgi:hypothetical protein